MSGFKQMITEATQRNVWVATDNQTGSGVIIQTDIVLTNFHLLEIDSEIQVDGKDVEILAVNPKLDLVLLKVPTRKVTPIKMSFKAEVGSEVFYVANTNRHKNYTSFGRITLVDEQYLYSDTTAVGGASGGGLYNFKGELIGILDAQEKNVIAVHIKAKVILNFLEQHKEVLK